MILLITFLSLNAHAFRHMDAGVIIGSRQAPVASAAFQIESTTQGFLAPRMTTTQRDLITATEGLQIYNTTASEQQYWDGSAWSSLGGGAGIGVPGTTIDNEIVRWDGVTGAAIQGYTSGGPTISDTGTVTLDGGDNSTSFTGDHTLRLDSTGNNGIGTNGTGNNLYIFNNSARVVTFSTSTIGPVLPISLQNGLVSAPPLTFAGMTDGGLYRDSVTDELRMSVNGVDSMVWDDNFVSAATVLSAGQFATGSLPAAASYEGYQAYDTTLNIPVFSDGSTWNSMSGGGGGASDIDGLTDGINDTSSVFLGTNSGIADDGTTNLNTGLGTDSIKATTTGSGNTAIGHSALLLNVSGGNNTAVGYKALRASNGSNNIGVGVEAMLSNTGSSNIAIGKAAMTAKVTGNNNVAIGHQALSSAGGGSSSNSVVIGTNAGFLTSSGSNNVYLGYQTGLSTTTGSNNIIVGYNIDIPTGATASYLNIGDAITGDISTGIVETAGAFGPGQYTTAGLPAAAAGNEGYVAYDTTLNIPVFSDGSTWNSMLGGGSTEIIDLDTFYRDNFSVNTTALFSVTGDAATPDNAGTGTMSGSFITRTGASAMNDIYDAGFLTNGGGTNDFFLSDTIAVKDLASTQTATFTFWYEYGGADDDMSFIVLDATNDTVISSATDLIKLTTKPTRFYTTIDIPSTCTSIRYGFQRNAGTLQSLYFTDVTFKTPMLELFETKILSADVTTTTDISDLQFDNLTIGRTYTLGGNIRSIVNTGVSAVEVRAFSAPSGGGTLYGLIHMHSDTGTAAVQNGFSPNITFVAVSTSVYIRSLIPFTSTIYGGGTKDETFVTLTEKVDAAETTKF